MGIKDRDWYKDALRQREAKNDARYFPKPFRSTRQPPPMPTAAPKAQMHWTLTLMLWATAFLLAYIVEHKWLWPIVERALTHWRNS